MAIASHVHPYIRYILPIYPFLIITAAWGITRTRNLRAYVVIGLFGIWLIAQTLFQYPHFLSYANEFLGPAKNRYSYLTDANIDWGQSLEDVAAYARRRQSALLSFSYFGRDNGDAYGLVSNFPWGSYKFDDICAFHEIPFASQNGPHIVAISISNWYGCGFWKDPKFEKKHITGVVGGSVLIFSP
jgi:hypothetical protein